MLLHGGGQTRHSWNELGYVDRLSKKFTVIRVDLRGSGDSGRPDTAGGLRARHRPGRHRGGGRRRRGQALPPVGLRPRRQHRPVPRRPIGSRDLGGARAADMGPTVTGPGEGRHRRRCARSGSRCSRRRRPARWTSRRCPSATATRGNTAWRCAAIALGALVDYPPLAARRHQGAHAVADRRRRRQRHGERQAVRGQAGRHEGDASSS